MKPLGIVLFFCLVSTLFISCDSTTVFDSMYDLDSNAWNENQELAYSFQIKDTSVRYKLFYSVRYDNNYPYYNLYVNRILEDSSGKFLNKKIQGMDLFKASTGVPYGNGMGSKKDYLIIAEDNYKFPYVGMYSIKLKQYMRQENIAGISAIGFRVEKVVKEN